jgi:hypothetical protein
LHYGIKLQRQKKTNLASTQNPPVEIENNLQVALVQVQAHDDYEAQAQSAMEANDEAPQSNRDIPTSIVQYDAATDEEGDNGADLEALEHDPRMPIPSQEETHFGPFGDVLILTQDRCTVCAEHTIGSEIVLDTPNGTLRLRWSSGNSFQSVWRQCQCRGKIGARFASNVP